MTKAQSVNYDAFAPAYHARYQENRLEGVGVCLRRLAKQLKAHRILEAGCGTGRWLAEFPEAAAVFGLDYSEGMLRQARADGPASLVQARAEEPPFAPASFDLVFCVNAFHHFSDRPRFIRSAFRLLRPGGALAVIGMDPHRGLDRWGIYDYFDGTRELDLQRFASSGTILDWMASAGFRQAEWRVAEHIRDNLSGEEILKSHFLGKNGTSQLVLITAEAYRQGLARIQQALAEAARANTRLVFPCEIDLVMVTGRV